VAKKQVNTLSRGYKQRLGVAQAILNSPRILILDEPTNGLDPSQILEMRSLIKELAETATLVVSTHILQEVQAVCNRVIIINNGTVALDEKLSSLQRSGRVRLNTDAQPDAFNRLIAEIDGLEFIRTEIVDGQWQYIVEPKNNEVMQASASLAKALIERGFNLYSMSPIVRDLETIFGEITASGAPIETDQPQADQHIEESGELGAKTADVESGEPAGNGNDKSKAEKGKPSIATSAQQDGGRDE
jgi:ABC-2 type transport system ATP-binding protein